jgi:hypothetical protein
LFLVLGGVPVKAQFGGAPGAGGPQQQPATRREENVQIKLLEIAQDVDETLLREAMLKLGRLAMTPKSDQPDVESARERKEAEAEKDALTRFIEQKRRDITERAAELRKTRAESIVPMRPNARVGRPDAQEKPGRIEEIEKAKADVQLLQTQVEYSQQSLLQAINELAQAELMAGVDESQREKVEAARKKFEKIKLVHIDYTKRLRDESAKLDALDPQSEFRGMGGMRGGMGGRGGGFR